MGLLDRIAGWGQGRVDSPHQAFPSYSALPTTSDKLDSPDTRSVEDDQLNHDNTAIPRGRPSTSRFLADFTLGFADGLTVPFALTAGLSSLGDTKTVIYAGMAEICAGCISMGIGGYLAARGEQRQDAAQSECRSGTRARSSDDGGEGALAGPSSMAAATPASRDSEVDNYLAPLRLPSDLLQSIVAHIESSPEVSKLVHESIYARGEPEPQPTKTSPFLSGLSIALGYLLGGLLPLGPYFFVNRVSSGLICSFVICLSALFIFGFTKECVLLTTPSSPGWGSTTAERRIRRWDVIRPGLWEGVRMVVLGGIAAVAAVLCVRLFDGFVS
ncbi:Ccc1 family [Poronia punctata]|nr:Ccc1 family [Poronia punctata]